MKYWLRKNNSQRRSVPKDMTLGPCLETRPTALVLRDKEDGYHVFEIDSLEEAQDLQEWAREIAAGFRKRLAAERRKAKYFVL